MSLNPELKKLLAEGAKEREADRVYARKQIASLLEGPDPDAVHAFLRELDEAIEQSEKTRARAVAQWEELRTAMFRDFLEGASPSGRT